MKVYFEEFRTITFEKLYLIAEFMLASETSLHLKSESRI